jgi:hypothetical protein
MVSLVKKENELEDILKNTGLTAREKKNLKRKMLDKEGHWIVDSISLPKRKIRKIRGYINQATSIKGRFPLLDIIEANKISGYIACLKAIYGGKLPKQVSVPYLKYIDSA